MCYFWVARDVIIPLLNFLLRDSVTISTNQIEFVNYPSPPKLLWSEEGCDGNLQRLASSTFYSQRKVLCYQVISTLRLFFTFFEGVTVSNAKLATINSISASE